MGESGIDGVPARTVLAIAAAAFIVADLILAAGWYQRVDARRLLSGVRHAPTYSARDFFVLPMTGLALLIAVVEPFYGPWPLAVLGAALAVLFLLTALALQAEAERTGTADAEREEHEAYKAMLRAMTPRQRLKYRAGLALFTAAAGVVLFWFKSLWRP